MSQRPNVIIIMTDQQRADLCAREGYPLDTTPFLDSLAKRGAWFDRAYTTTPLCGPARASLVTGRYPSATRCRTNHNLDDVIDCENVFQLFHENGYKTALCGKNHSHLSEDRPEVDFWFETSHLGTKDPDPLPQNRAFDDFLKNQTHFHFWREASPHPAETQLPFRIGNKAKDWVDETVEAGDPFFLWLSYPEPHNPFQVSEPYYSMFSPEDLPKMASDESDLKDKSFKYNWCRESFLTAFPDFADDLPRLRANYHGMLRMIDDSVKDVVGHLEQKNLIENTVIVFLSDHGDFVGEYGLMRKGPELPEALTRIPFFVTGPGVVANGSAREDHVSLADVMPTVLEAAGIEIPAGVQGRSLWPMVTGGDYPEADFASAYAEVGFGGLNYDGSESLDPEDDGRKASPDGESWGAYDCLNSWTMSGQMRMVRKGDWKLVWDMNGHGQLYNVVDDPAELKDLFDDPSVASKQKELMADLLTWILRTQDPLPYPRRRYVVKRDNRNYWEPYK